METLIFKRSQTTSVGVELELQIVDPHSLNLTARAKDLIRSIRGSKFDDRIKPEITQGMIEINSSIHHSLNEMYQEFMDMHAFLLEQAKKFKVYFCGGGTHPFQKWAFMKIFPTQRYKYLARQFRYLSKRFTVFGQHVHIGCRTPEDALYLTHALARYVPQLIALSASSPFYQGVDTGFHSSRSNIFSAFPLSGVIPYLTTWKEFSAYYYKMKNLNIISSMKDFYWDIRPKPEYGTVEVRVCDTPLTIKKAITIAAYIQSLSRYLIEERINTPTQDLYYLYSYNRFQASRYGFDGTFINPYTYKRCSIKDDIISTVKIIEKYTHELKNETFMALLLADVMKKYNDTVALRDIYKKATTLPQLVRKQCSIWRKNCV